jgi:hypothetical protein
MRLEMQLRARAAVGFPGWISNVFKRLFFGSPPGSLTGAADPPPKVR